MKKQRPAKPLVLNKETLKVLSGMSRVRGDNEALIAIKTDYCTLTACYSLCVIGGTDTCC